MSDRSAYTDAIALKSALEDLLGSEEWYKLKDFRGLGVWKKSLLRALKVSKVAIEGTIEIYDEDWRVEAYAIIERGKSDLCSATTISEAFSNFSACYMRLSFHQLGLMPRKTGIKFQSRAIPSSWQLNAHRSVQYVQSEKQKLRLSYSKDPRPISEKALDPKYTLLRS